MSKKAANASFAVLPRILIALFAFVGFGIMAYLTYIHYANAQSFCDLSETVSCDVVTTSIYSEIFGLPISILGLAYFAIIIYLFFYKKTKYTFEIIFFLTLFVIIPSAYFTLTEIFFIKAFCILCETSKVIMLAILVVSLTILKKQKTGSLLSMSMPIIIAGLAAAGVTFFAQSGVGSPNKDYSAFVMALNEKGVVYYKSVKCNNCKRQERLLGPAYKKLNSVECHPEGENPRPEYCLEKKIQKTPTFSLEKDGVELKRLEGLQSLKTLAEWAEVPFEDK